MTTTNTRSLLLMEAEILIRTRGYTAFSYADLAEKVGIRKASIHHHFPTKEELGSALIDEYLERFATELETLSARKVKTFTKLRAYGNFFIASLNDGKLPLCAALAADAAFLPKSMQHRVTRFFEMHLEWLEAVFVRGLEVGDWQSDIDPKSAARALLSALEGASVVAWAVKDPAITSRVLESTLSMLQKSMLQNHLPQKSQPTKHRPINSPLRKTRATEISIGSKK